MTKGTDEMIADHPLLSGLIVVDRHNAGLEAAWRLWRTLRQQKFDLVLELSGGDRGSFYTLISGGRERVGFTRPRQPFWPRGVTFTRLLPRPPVRLHLVDYNLEAVRALGVEPQNPRLEFFWKPEVEARVLERLQDLGLAAKDFAVVHPGAGWRFKSWNPAGYARVIEALEDELGLPVVLTGSRAAHEQELIAAVLSECRAAPRNLAGQLTLKELGALIAKARLFFGVDSAPMHLAAAVNTPTVALFGPSGAFNWAPWGEGHLVIQRDWDCVPCGADGCQGSKISRCLEDISPEEVIAALREKQF